MKISFSIVDDFELDRIVAKKMLLKSGLCENIKLYSNAIELLENIKKNPIINHRAHVVLLDILMPVMSGFQFLDEFENLPLNIQEQYQIISITTSLYKNDLERLNGYSSVKGVLKKPYTISSLKEVLERIIK